MRASIWALALALLAVAGSAYATEADMYAVCAISSTGAYTWCPVGSSPSGGGGSGGGGSGSGASPGAIPVNPAGTVITGNPIPFAVSSTNATVTGLTLPGKVRFQATPVSPVGTGSPTTVAVQINYVGGNACTTPGVTLLPGQIDDWVYISTTTAPTVCAAAGTTVLMVQ